MEKGDEKKNHEQRVEESATNDNTDDDIDIYEPPTPPDGGWGWVVMIAAFFINLIVDGICYTFGIIFNDLQMTFKTIPEEEGRPGTSDAIIALVGSLVPGVYLLVGPFVSVLANRFGCRIVSVIGSLIAAIFFFISSFSDSIVMMLFTYGILGGLGFGLMYLPSIVMVGHYFDKRRAFATGITVCGSGIGTFVFAPLGSYLVDEYTWRGANMIIAGIILNGCIFGMCFRPLKAKRARCVTVKQSNIMNTIAESKRRNRTISGCSASDGTIITTENHFLPKVDEVEAQGAGGEMNANQSLAVCVGSRTSMGSRRGNGAYHRSGNNMAASSRSIHDIKKSNQELANPMNRQDALLVGSVKNLPEYKSAHNVEEYTKSITNFPDPEESTASKIKNFLFNMFDFSLLKCITFIMLCSSGVLVFLGLYTPFVYVVQKATNELDATKQQAGNILLIIGICNTVSRVITGLVSDLPQVDVMVIQNVAAILAGVATCLVAVLNSMALLYLYAAFFGVTIAAFIALRSIVMVEMLGLKKLNNAFGLTALFQGIAVLIGSPMSGAMYASTGSLVAPFVVCGVLIALGGIICIPVRRVAKWENPKGDETIKDPQSGSKYIKVNENETKETECV